MEGSIQLCEISIHSCLNELFSQFILVLSIHGEWIRKNGIPEKGMKNRGYWSIMMK